MIRQDSKIQNELYDQVYVSAVEIDGTMYHAREEGGEVRIVVDATTRLPIPIWVCICHATKYEECACGAWEMYLPVEDEWTSKEIWLPPEVKENLYRKWGQEGRIDVGMGRGSESQQGEVDNLV